MNERVLCGCPMTHPLDQRFDAPQTAATPVPLPQQPLSYPPSGAVISDAFQYVRMYFRIRFVEHGNGRHGRHLSSGTCLRSETGIRELVRPRASYKPVF